MADRLYLGPVSKQLRGNREDALRLEREARIKVGYLFDSMMPGQTFKTGSWSLGDGRRIMAFVWNDVLGKRATVRLIGIGGEAKEYNYLLMDTGWLQPIETEDGYLVSIWEALQTYYTGGLVKLNALVYEGAGSFAGVPDVDATYTYVSSNKDRSTYNVPTYKNHRYSGLARLLAQSLMGAQRKDGIHSLEDLYVEIKSRLPAGILLYNLPDPRRTGLIRAPNGDYWLILLQDKRTDPDSADWQGKAVGVRLVPSTEFAKLNLDINSGKISPEDAKLADAFVLGYCEIGGDYVVFSDSDAWDFDFDTDPFAQLFSKAAPIESAWPQTNISINRFSGILDFTWGWVWKWQFRGEADEKVPGGIIITGKRVTTYNGPATYDAGYVCKKMEISFTFDAETNRPAIVYDEEAPWYHTVFSTLRDPVYFLEEESIGVDDNTIPIATTTSLTTVKVADQDLTKPNIIYAWYNRLGGIEYVKESHIYSLIASSLTTEYVEGITVCACSVWRIETSSKTERFAGLVISNDDTDEDTLYESAGIGYTDGYYTPEGHWNQYYGLTWTESAPSYIASGTRLFVSSTPGVFWFVGEDDPNTASFYGTYNYVTHEETGGWSGSEPNLLLGIWERVGRTGYGLFFTVPELPCDPSNCFSDINETSWAYTRVDKSKNTLSTGKELVLVTEADAAASAVLGGLHEAILAASPDDVEDLLLFARAAYNISGYLYGDAEIPGLCGSCIEANASNWIGGA